jgi:Ca2+-binding EF-hand superfamily protein
MEVGEKYLTFGTPKVVLQSLFRKYDLNQNGFLEEEELRSLLEQDLGMNPDQADVFTLLIDKKGEHKVSYSEFVDWLHSDERYRCINDTSRFHLISKAVELFRQFDSNDNGSLDRREFLRLVRSLGYQHVNNNIEFQKMDNDGNGVISFWEFLRWLNWIPIQ